MLTLENLIILLFCPFTKFTVLTTEGMCHRNIYTGLYLICLTFSTIVSEVKCFKQDEQGYGTESSYDIVPDQINCECLWIGILWYCRSCSLDIDS